MFPSCHALKGNGVQSFSGESGGTHKGDEEQQKRRFEIESVDSYGSFFPFPPRCCVVSAIRGSGRGEEPSGGECPPSDSDPLNDVEF
jgi:hypothetical protein